MDSRPTASGATEAFQVYLQGLKSVWKDPIYRAVVASAATADGDDAKRLEQALSGTPAYGLYGWLERHLQQFKYFGRWGLEAAVAGELDRLLPLIEEGAARHPERLSLDPALALPDYYTQADFHQHRGGVWSSDLAALVYEWAADRYSFALQDSTAPYVRFAQRVLELQPADRILDLGCGFGKSTLPFKRLSPGSEVFGVDLSAPCLRLAHLRAQEQELEIQWRQAAAEALPYPDGAFDTVACYWLLHELPSEVQAAVLGEAFRVLRPGGVFASHDMHTVPGGTLGELLHLGHAARNQEPYLADTRLERLAPLLGRAGFADVEILSNDPRHAPELDGAPLSPTRVHVNTVLLARKPVA